MSRREEAAFDEVIHEKTRLRITSILAGVDTISFPQLRDMVGVSDSVLSKHLKALQQAGYVVVSKLSSDGHARSTIALAPKGRRAFHAHVAALEAMISQIGAPDLPLADAALTSFVDADHDAERHP